MRGRALRAPTLSFRVGVLGALFLFSVSTARAQGRPADSGGQEERRIDLNESTVSELQTLRGVGQKRAEAIVAYRERRPFTRVSQLLNIRGIGKKTLRRLRPRLSIGARGPEEARAAVKRGRARMEARTASPSSPSGCPEPVKPPWALSREGEDAASGETPTEAQAGEGAGGIGDVAVNARWTETAAP